MESFFATSSRSWFRGENSATREQATASIFKTIEAFDNRVRRHSLRGYVAPAEFEGNEYS